MCRGIKLRSFSFAVFLSFTSAYFSSSARCDEHHANSETPLVMHAQKPTVKADYGGEIPFTAVDLWTRLLPLFARDHGYVDRVELEKILGVRLNADPISGDWAPSYSLKAKRDWYLEVSLVQFSAESIATPESPRGKQSSLEITLAGGQFTEGPFGRCLPREIAERDLLDLGWDNFHSDHLFLAIDELQNRHIQSFIEKNADNGMTCVAKISIGGKDLQ